MRALCVVGPGLLPDVVGVGVDRHEVRPPIAIEVGRDEARRRQRGGRVRHDARREVLGERREAPGIGPVAHLDAEHAVAVVREPHQIGPPVAVVVDAVPVLRGRRQLAGADDARLERHRDLAAAHERSRIAARAAAAMRDGGVGAPHDDLEDAIAVVVDVVDALVRPRRAIRQRLAVGVTPVRNLVGREPVELEGRPAIARLAHAAPDVERVPPLARIRVGLRLAEADDVVAPVAVVVDEPHADLAGEAEERRLRNERAIAVRKLRGDQPRLRRRHQIREPVAVDVTGVPRDIGRRDRVGQRVAREVSAGSRELPGRAGLQRTRDRHRHADLRGRPDAGPVDEAGARHQHVAAAVAIHVGLQRAGVRQRRILDERSPAAAAISDLEAWSTDAVEIRGIDHRIGTAVAGEIPA